MRRLRAKQRRRPPAQLRGLGEGLAVMLSVVVFGLGVMTLVARDEVRSPLASSGFGARSGVAAHVAPPGASVLPARDVAR